MIDRESLLVVGAWEVLMLAVGGLACVIFGGEEPVVFNLEAELQACMDQSDHQFKLCVDDMTERFRQVDDDG